MLPDHMLLHGRKAGPCTDSTQLLLLLFPAWMKAPERTWLQLGGAGWCILVCVQTCSWHQAGTGVNPGMHRATCQLQTSAVQNGGI